LASHTQIYRLFYRRDHGNGTSASTNTNARHSKSKNPRVFGIILCPCIWLHYSASSRKRACHLGKRGGWPTGSESESGGNSPSGSDSDSGWSSDSGSGSSSSSSSGGSGDESETVRQMSTQGGVELPTNHMTSNVNLRQLRVVKAPGHSAGSSRCGCMRLRRCDGCESFGISLGLQPRQRLTK
jgi:hypothetical protein